MTLCHAADADHDNRLTYVESFPFDGQYPCRTANFPLCSFHRLRHCRAQRYCDPCNFVVAAAAAAGCGCLSLNFSWHHEEGAFEFRAVVDGSWSYSDAWVAEAEAAAAVVAAAVAYDAEAFPPVVGEVSAMAGAGRTGCHAFLQRKSACFPPVTAEAFRREAFPSADFLGDTEDGHSLAAADGAAAFGCAARGVPKTGDGPAEVALPQGFRSAVRPDHRTEPSF